MSYKNAKTDSVEARRMLADQTTTIVVKIDGVGTGLSDMSDVGKVMHEHLRDAYVAYGFADGVKALECHYDGLENTEAFRNAKAHLYKALQSLGETRFGSTSKKSRVRKQSDEALRNARTQEIEKAKEYRLKIKDGMPAMAYKDTYRDARIALDVFFEEYMTARKQIDENGDFVKTASDVAIDNGIDSLFAEHGVESVSAVQIARTYFTESLRWSYRQLYKNSAS